LKGYTINTKIHYSIFQLGLTYLEPLFLCFPFWLELTECSSGERERTGVWWLSLPYVGVDPETWPLVRPWSGGADGDGFRGPFKASNRDTASKPGGMCSDACSKYTCGREQQCSLEA